MLQQNFQSYGEMLTCSPLYLLDSEEFGFLLPPLYYTCEGSSKWHEGSQFFIVLVPDRGNIKYERILVILPIVSEVTLQKKLCWSGDNTSPSKWKNCASFLVRLVIFRCPNLNSSDFSDTPNNAATKNVTLYTVGIKRLLLVLNFEVWTFKNYWITPAQFLISHS